HDRRLQLGLLVGVGMAAVHHDVGRYPGSIQLRLAAGDVFRRVVGPAAAAPQDHVGVLVAPGVDDRDPPLVVDAQEAVGAPGGGHGVDGHAQAAVGAVLEAHGTGQPAGHFPVGLGFGGASADGRPGDAVLQVLGRD